MPNPRNSTIVFLIKKSADGKISDICLAMKKRGFGVNRWNGVGGKVEHQETIEEAAIRETKEEINVLVKNLNKVAEINFHFPLNPSWNNFAHIYTTETWDGDPQESEEMFPKWFATHQIPFQEMWPDDTFWLPQVLEGNLLKATFKFGENDIIHHQEVNIVEVL